MRNLVDRTSRVRSGVYIIRNFITGEFYIGSSKYLGHRFSGHDHQLAFNKNRCGVLQRAINKYGTDNFTFDVLEFVDPSNLLEREQYYLDTLIPRYNIIKSVTPIIMPEESRKKMSNSHKGVKLSEAHRKALSEGQKGRVCSPETRIKISKSNKLTFAAQRLLEGRELIIKNPNPIPHGQGRHKAVKVINMLTGDIYDTITCAANAFGIKRTTLQSQLSGTNRNRTILAYA